MRPKEVQLLGILALIAAAVILVSVWMGPDRGSEKAVSEPVGQTEPAHHQQVTSDLDQLLQRIQEKEAESSALAQGEGTPGTLELGRSPTERDVDVAEGLLRDSETQISEQLDDKEPREVPLIPQEKEPEEPPATVTHVVKKGESLSGISRLYYDAPGRWRLIVEANKDLVKDPNRIRPGMKLVIPFPPSARAKKLGKAGGNARMLGVKTPVPGKKIYEVRKGDTLYKIAAKFYEDGRAWKDILAANSDLIKGPQELQPGMRLILP